MWSHRNLMVSDLIFIHADILWLAKQVLLGKFESSNSVNSTHHITEEACTELCNRLKLMFDYRPLLNARENEFDVFMYLALCNYHENILKHIEVIEDGIWLKRSPKPELKNYALRWIVKDE